MRKIFIKELIKAAKKNKKIILIVNDLGYGVVDNFAKKFPKQFINAGVAEQNMMGLAAGLAMDGNHVFVYSIGNFSTFRCAEQIRNDIDYHKLAVTIINVGPGVDYGHLGYSHHSIQDYSLMRTMPNMLISSPSNNKETKIVTKYLLKSRNPNYLRLSKHEEVLTDDLNYNVNSFKPGKWIKLKNGKDKKKAIYTLYAIKGRDTKYQVNVVSTMLGRAKKHPNKTPEMDDAITVFEKWLLDYKKSKDNTY